ncbi:MAG: hypothetical protein ACYCT9_10510, partial [Leptospirillum sp.]
VRRLTVQSANRSPFSVRGVGRKESPSFPLSRRAKREGGEDVNILSSPLVPPIRGVKAVL